MNRGQAFLLLVLALAGLLVFVLVLPFVEYVLLAIILAYVLYPAHRRLQKHVGSSVSPILLILGSILVAVVPLLYIGNRLLSELEAIAEGETGLQTGVIEAEITELTGLDVDLVEVLSEGGEWLLQVLFGDVTGIVTMGLHMSLGFALVFFLVFYLLRDGPEFLAWLRPTIPLPRRVTDRLFFKIERTTWGAVIGHGFAALVQSVVAGLGLYFVGLPNVLFLTFVMFVLAFLPLIGVFLVWAPAAIYLVLIGETAGGVLLAIYGFTIVSMIDYYVRPIVIDQQARLNPGVILVGVFGGLYTLGFIGIFVGPIAIGILAATLEVFRADYDRI